MTGYIEGYRKAATAVFEHAVNTRTSPDFILFPMAFLWRHHLELVLKDIIALGRRLAGEPWGFPLGHGLMKLWREARPHIIQCGDPNAPELANVEANLREFEQVDPGADGFRYPFNGDRDTRSLDGVPDKVNLQVLQDSMEALANFFEGVRSELSSRLDYLAEMEAEYTRQYDHDYE
jgi:hypothetical protein